MSAIEFCGAPRAGWLLAVVAGVVCGWPLQSAAQVWQTALEAGDYTLALRELDAALDVEPNNTALRYQRARTLALAGSPEAALAEFDALAAQFPADADYLLGRAQMQARLGRDAEAVESTERALALAPDYEDVWQLRLRLAERAGEEAATAALRSELAVRFPEAQWWRADPTPIEYRSWLSAGSGTERLSNDAPDWSRHFLRVDWQTTAAGTWFAEMSRSERFEEADSSLYVGVNRQALAQWQIGGGFAITDDARFLPERELSVDATRSWAGGWGTAFGARGRDYATGGSVTSYSFTAEKYLSDYRIAYRLDRSQQSGVDDSALAHVLQLTWYASDRRNLGVAFGTGEEIEVIGLDRLLHTSVRNVTFSGNERFSPRLSLSWWLGTHEQGVFYRRDYAGLAIRIGL
jgi:YaiO family outer membrane protein